MVEVALPEPAPRLWLRMARSGNAVAVSWSVDGDRWQELRLAWFPPQVPVLAGVMCAAPDGPGFAARFSQVRLASS